MRYLQSPLVAYFPVVGSVGSQSKVVHNGSLTHGCVAEGLLELQSVARDASDCGKLSDPGVKDEDPGLIEVGPSGGELIVEHESLLVVVGTVLGEGGRASGAGCG